MLATAPDMRQRRRGAYENPRPEVQALVPTGARRILDLGCSSGALGAALKQRQGAEVVGVELDTAYAKDAGAVLDEVVVADVEQFLADGPRDHVGAFDCLIAADLLEHLRDPWGALAAAVDLLEQAGTAVISLPNVAYWETFWQLGVKRTWPRRDDGIFDRTHLRWFTLRDAWEMMDGAGLEVTRVSRRYRLKPGDWRTERWARPLARTPLRPFFVFQHVIVGVKRSA